jgi:hypothetical protein
LRYEKNGWQLSGSFTGQQEIQIAGVFGSSGIGPKVMEHFGQIREVPRLRRAN